MEKRVVSGIIFTLLLVGMLTLTFNIRSVKAPDGTELYIYIRADGSIEPSGAPIGTTDKINYRIYDDVINRSIIVERDNITLRGFNHIVKGNESLRVGIDLTRRKNVTLEDVRVTKFNYGILLNSSRDCRLRSSTIWENWAGVWIEDCLRTEILFSNISYNNYYGIRMYSGGNNELINNIIWRNCDGINIWYSGTDRLIGNDVSLNFGTGILLYYSMGGTWLAGNNVSSNGYFGISIRESSDVRMNNNNKASNNRYNFDVDGTSYRDFTTHTIDTTNTVDGKPIYYIKGASDSIYDADTNAGTIYLINCKNVTIRNLNLTDNGCGILLWNTTQSRIENVSVSGNVYGVRLEKSSKDTITLNNMARNQYGIWIKDCNETKIIQNDVATNQFGLFINSSMLNNISRNSISENMAYGIRLEYSSNNTITQNIIAENGEEVFPEPPFFFGIELYNSGNNTLYHNSFINNYGQAYAISSNDNKWDNGWPSGGNYWSDYAGDDTDNDGIGYPSYEIDAHNIDMYPLMGMFHSFNTSLGYSVDVISNSTIEDFGYFESNGTIRMQVSNTTTNQAYGFCRLTIPHDLLSPPYNVTVNGVSIPYTTVFENETLSIIYFSYEHSELKIVVIPEFASSMMLLTWLMFIMIPLILTKKTRDKKAKT